MIEQADEAPFNDDLTADEIAAIDEGLAQIKRGERIDADALFDRLAKKFGFERP